jgi:hypothetical protein
MAEARDVNVRNILKITAGLCATVLFALLVTFLLFRLLKRTDLETAASSTSDQQRFNAPVRLQTNEYLDLEKKRLADEAKLNSYGWVDRKGGIVRIPIERAMDMIAARGGAK